MEVIGISIFSGLITTFIVLFVTLFWKSVILQWYENFLYRDAKIEGRWYGKSDYFDKETDAGLLDIKHKSISNFYTIDISRTGHTINATMTCTDGWEQGRTYILQGTFKNLMLTATYDPEDKTSMERASMTLILKSNGRRFLGFVSMYMDEFDLISPGRMIWDKQGVDGHLEQEEEGVLQMRDNQKKQSTT